MLPPLNKRTLSTWIQQRTEELEQRVAEAAVGHHSIPEETAPGDHFPPLRETTSSPIVRSAEDCHFPRSALQPYVILQKARLTSDMLASSQPSTSGESSRTKDLHAVYIKVPSTQGGVPTTTKIKFVTDYYSVCCVLVTSYSLIFIFHSSSCHGSCSRFKADNT